MAMNFEKGEGWNEEVFDQMGLSEVLTVLTAMTHEVRYAKRTLSLAEMVEGFSAAADVLKMMVADIEENA
jgi:hypothetical protein